MSKTTQPTCSILAIGDPHFKIDNIEQSEKFYCEVDQYLFNNKNIDFIVILGDVLHTHEKINTFAMNMAIKFIKMCSSYTQTYVLVGNHDATSNTIFCGTNHWMNGLKDMSRVIVCDKPTYIKTSNNEELNVLCCPYVSDGRFEESVNMYANSWNNASLIFAHQLFDGAKMGAIVSSGVEFYKPSWPLCISGHIHEKQRVSDNLYYCGSSQQLAFGEKDDKSLCLVNIDKGNISFEDVYLDITKRKTLYVTLENLEDIQKTIDKTYKEKNNIEFKIVIKDDEHAIKSFKKTQKYDQLMKSDLVKSVQFKPIVRDREESKQTNNTEFLTILQTKINKSNDPYLKSYVEHVLYNREDFSNKDVYLV